MKKFFLLIISIFPLLFLSQGLQSGLILPQNDEDQHTDKYCCVLSPKEGFTVYDSPNGKKTGTLKMLPPSEKDSQTPYHIYFFTGKNSVEVQDIDSIGYDVFALEYADIQKGFVKIDYNVKGWLKLEEIKASKFKTVNWLQYLQNKNATVLGYYANEPGLNLRANPSSDSEVIGGVRGDQFEIKLTNNCTGQWCKVNIIKYREHPCNTDLEETENIEYRTEGWMKIIDDNGKPNIWSYQKGC